MSGKHHAPTVVRYWIHGYGPKPINAIVHDWDQGSFTLPVGHELARKIMAHSQHEDCLTVASTPELEWRIDRWLVHERWLAVRCIPRKQRVANTMAPDAMLIELGLVQR